MLNKTTIYGLGVAAFVALLGFVHWGESKFPGDSLRANVATEAELASQGIDFSTDYAEATLRAERENKPQLLFFMSKKCKYSQEMLANAFASDEISRLSQEFVCVELDVNDPRNDEICDELNISATPTIQFASSRGVPLQRLTRIQTADRLAVEMQAALTSIAWRESQTESRPTYLR